MKDLDEASEVNGEKGAKILDPVSSRRVSMSFLQGVFYFEILELRGKLCC